MTYTPNTPAAPELDSPPPLPSRQPPRNRRTWLIAVIALIAGAAIGGGAMAGFTNSRVERVAGPTVTSTVTETASLGAPAATATAPHGSPSTGAALPAPLSINASGVLAGNAKPHFPSGEPGKVAVVQIGQLDKNAGGAELLVVIRNNTNKGVAHVDLSAVARNSSGKVVATGSSQGFEPAQIQPGEPALGFIYFEADKALPPNGATYTFTADVEPADASSYNTGSVKIDEANNTGQAIVGTGMNTTGAKLTGPYSVTAYCFSPAGQLIATNGAFAEPDSDLVPGARVSFTIDLYGTRCPRTTAVDRDHCASRRRSWHSRARAWCLRRHVDQVSRVARVCRAASSTASKRRRNSLTVSSISPAGAGAWSRSIAVATARNAWASMARVVQRCHEVQTWCWSKPVRPFAAWKDSSMRQRCPATRTSVDSGTGLGL